MHPASRNNIVPADGKFAQGEILLLGHSSALAWTTQVQYKSGLTKVAATRHTKPTWLCLCLATREVHLEAVTDYTSDAFTAVYRRFVSRRGVCSTITSDQGTNFIGAACELQDLQNSLHSQSEEIVTLLAREGTTWKFSPPGAPHFGGIWEAAVKSVKHHLKRIMGDTTSTYVRRDHYSFNSNRSVPEFTPSTSTVR